MTDHTTDDSLREAGENTAPPRTAGQADEALRKLADRPVLRSLLLVFLTLAAFLPGLLSVPPIDRDEARFAQATRQMMETGDYVDIRFQDEPRHKKPVGIYWFQAAAVSVGEAMGVDDAQRQIWLYRIPSQIGAIVAVLALVWAGTPLVGGRAAIIGAAGLALTILLGVEARLAKTDAFLLATVVIAHGVLIRAWLAPAGERFGPRLFLLFWIALGVGLLIKGPIGPFAVGMTALSASVLRRDGRWLLALRPLFGVALMLAIAAPWFVAISLQSKGAFFQESVGQDFVAKLLGGQESHGAPPGVYLLSIWGTLWPVSPFLLLALPSIWRRRREPATMFLMAWVIPAWLLLELVPTKLPHYVLPLVPALMLAAGRWLTDPDEPRWLWWPAIALLLLGAVGVPVAAVIAGYFYDGSPSFSFEPFAMITALAGIWAAVALYHGQVVTAFVRSGVSALLLYAGIYGFAFPELRALWLSPRLAATAKAVSCGTPQLMTSGFREPSLVFLTQTDIAMADGAEAARFLTQGECRVAFVEAREEAAFDQANADNAHSPRLMTRVKGININGGRELDIAVYTTADKR